MFTVLGKNGFIGKNLLSELKSRNLPFYAPEHDEIHSLMHKKLGVIVYCIGATGNFRDNIPETFRSNFILLDNICRYNSFKSIIYLSSTYVYHGLKSTEEEQEIIVAPYDISDTYLLSKLAAESFLLHSCSNVKILRLSHVYGMNCFTKHTNFLESLFFNAAKNGTVTLLSSSSSERDFVPVKRVVDCILEISKYPIHGIFNIASGINVSNSELEKILAHHGVIVDYDDNASDYIFPRISIQKISSLLDKHEIDKFNILTDLERLFCEYKLHAERLSA